MRFTFLGTSAGVPTPHRNVSGLALAVEDGRDWYLIDCGEGTQHRLLQTRYSGARLRAIFITHVHGDHCFGLPGLIASINMSGRREPLTLCAPDGVRQFLESTLHYTDIRQLRFPLQFLASDDAGFQFEDEHLRATATPLSHRVPCYAYRFEERPRRAIDGERLTALGVPRGPAWGELQAGREVLLGDGRRVAPEQVTHPAWPARSAIVAGDNDRPQLLHGAMRQSDLLIHEATFTEDVLARVGPRYMHSTAAMVADAAREAELRHLVLTHFSQRYHSHPGSDQRGLDELRAEALHRYHGNLILAEDLACYQLQRDKSLEAIKK